MHSFGYAVGLGALFALLSVGRQRAPWRSEDYDERLTQGITCLVSGLAQVLGPMWHHRAKAAHSSLSAPSRLWSRKLCFSLLSCCVVHGSAPTRSYVGYEHSERRVSGRCATCSQSASGTSAACRGHTSGAQAACDRHVSGTGAPCERRASAACEQHVNSARGAREQRVSGCELRIETFACPIGRLMHERAVGDVGGPQRLAM